MTTEESIAIDGMRQLDIKGDLEVFRNAERIRDLVSKAFDDMSICVEGVYNDNGADYLSCPGCSAREDQRGGVGHSNSMTSVTHDSSCELMALYLLTLPPKQE